MSKCDHDKRFSGVFFLPREYHGCVACGFEQITAENERLQGEWLGAIEAIDWMEVKTAHPCRPYPQEQRDIDREALSGESK